MFLEQQIIAYMISGGSCDIEDWSKDTENLALPSKQLMIL